MRKYRIKVETPGKEVTFKNRKIRSPFTLVVSDSDLNLVRAVFASSGIKDYSVEKFEREKIDAVDVVEPTWEDIITNEVDTTVVEELFDESEEEPTTLLKKLLKDNRMEKAK